MIRMDEELARRRTPAISVNQLSMEYTRISEQVTRIVSKEEIDDLADLMRIEVDDHKVHVDRLQQMIKYLSILDSVKGDGELHDKGIPLSDLREDKSVNFEGDLSKCIKTQDGYVCVPRMP